MAELAQLSGRPALVDGIAQREVEAVVLARNGHPRQRLDPDADARTLIERFHVEPPELPIVLCPFGPALGEHDG